MSIFKERSKENNNYNQYDDDDDDHGIEHLRYNIIFLDKKQGWCYIIARLQQSLRELPEWLKLKKKKSGKCKDLRRRVTRLRSVNASKSRKSLSFGYGEECRFFRLG